jgi:hypothetical protein
MQIVKASPVKFPKISPARLSPLGGSKVDAYKSAKELASKVEVDRAGNGFITSTHYPSRGIVQSVHSNIHSVNTHLRSTLGSPKGNLRNE